MFLYYILMVKYELVDGGYIINETLYRGEGSTPDTATMALAMQRGEDVIYDKDRSNYIDYPGEYDVAGYAIQSWTDKSNKLHAIVMMDGKKVALIQSVEGLDADPVNDMHTWLVTDETIADAIEKRELGGTVVIMK